MAYTTAADRLALFVLAVLAGVVLVFREPWYLLALVATCAAVLLVIAVSGRRSRLGDAIHKLASPYVAVGCTFEISGPVIARATHARWDDYFAALDARLFGHLVDAWQGVLGRPAWLTDVMSLAYVSFYFFPLAVGTAIYLRHAREFDRYALATEASFFIPFIGYFATPATGPRLALAHETGGTIVGSTARAFIAAVEINQLDAFPSGHAAVALVVLAFGWRILPRWRAPLALVAAGIVFSTVYLSYHYVVDLVAGGVVALLVPVLLPVLGRAFGLHTGERPA